MSDVGLALTPPMGFNNRSSLHCRPEDLTGAERPEFNEVWFKKTTDFIAGNGLKEAGYRYVNLDACWAEPKRDKNQNLVPNMNRFPSGIKALADYVHGKGLKFGIYSSAGKKTCAGDGNFPGALNHEETDAQLFAEWGVDYLTYDACGNDAGLELTGKDDKANRTAEAKERSTAMRDALLKTGRPIVYSVCERGTHEPWTWATGVSHLWRTTREGSGTWPHIVQNLHLNEKLAGYAGPGRWNDPDVLDVGSDKLTPTEYRSQFSLWSVSAAPLLIATNLLEASDETLAILKNQDVIDVDQDRLGKQGTRVSSAKGLHVYSKELDGGDRAVVLFNETGQESVIGTTASAVGMRPGSAYSLRDLWTKETRTITAESGEISASVPGHGVVMYRVSTAHRASRGSISNR
ncbi:glycoside hydrolase family 27 protein [Streptomyces sp. NBC_00879]|uniref:glycoside hydrolase family 27 protein n=1 Tax=Streptomyces sp. NBC_00879 TaxID=2975855 RepID=UPI0038694D0E|nr:glycoside hydrolase family 27 protein [Streptomyces sp. NBC_00879]